MDSNFGQFITKEYGLLKQILSYLKPCDLHNARLVCKEWGNAVDNLVAKTPLILSYQHGQKDPMPYPKRPFLPDLVIYNSVISGEILRKRCKGCEKNFPVCVCEITGPETRVLMSFNKANGHRYDPDLYSFWQIPSVFTFSSPENIKILTYTTDVSKKRRITKHPIDGSLTDVNEPIKGIFAVACSNHSNRKLTERLLNEVVDTQGLSFAVGGGIAPEVLSRNIGVDDQNKLMVTFIIFKGDNVSAHSELITSKDQDSMEKSMEQLKEKAGEVPEGGSRIAFITQCVERKSSCLEKLESGLFRKYFPNVPQFGFRAFGELGIKNGSSDGAVPMNRQKRKKITFSHAYTTSILIITFRKAYNNIVNG